MYTPSLRSKRAISSLTAEKRGGPSACELQNPTCTREDPYLLTDKLL